MIEICKPEIEDLWFRQLILSDSETMAYNRAWGGTISFPKERWNAWYASWVECKDGKRYYRYIMNDGVPVGEMAYHYDDELGGYIANVIVYAKYRGRGIGGRALDLLCSAAKENGICVLYDDISADNPAIRLFLRHGFVETYRTGQKIVLKKRL